MGRLRTPSGRSWRDRLGRSRYRHRERRRSGVSRSLLAGLSGLLVVSALTTTAVGASRHGPAARTHATGGSLTVLENVAFIGDWPEGLDPATNTDTLLANASMLDAIYGGLFLVSPKDTIQPDLATSYQITNGGKTFVIHLRPGVTFSDGSPFNAAAVIFNFKRDLYPPKPSNPAWPPVASMTAPNPLTVDITFTAPDGAAADQILDTSADWIVSPTSLRKEGEQRFRNYPVGAGPFEVVSDTPSVKLVLKRNPHYWQAGHPYLSSLTFETVSSDEAALETLQAHNAQAYEYLTTPQLVSAFKSAGLNVTTDPGTAALDVQINAGVAPFTNPKAREALYYATDNQAIDQKIFHGTCPLSQSFTGPDGLFYEPKVPGYRNYDLAKAKALVKQLGGLSFTMYYLTSGAAGQDLTVALQTMFEQAGMHVKISAISNLGAFVAEYNTHRWQVIPASIGSYDPAGGIGVAFRLLSTGPFTGVHDPIVDRYINGGAQAVNPKVRASQYAKLASYLSQAAYTPFICSPDSWDVAAKGVSGPGLTTPIGGFGEGPLVLWQDVTVKG